MPVAVKSVIIRYNHLLSEGYRSLNMNPVQEVATPEQATKLYHHMAAMGEGKLKMDSTLTNISFVKVEKPGADEVIVETKETWDFSHVDLQTGRVVAEEKNFIYAMRYLLKYADGRWLVHAVTALGGESVKTVIPWADGRRREAARPVSRGEPAKAP